MGTQAPETHLKEHFCISYVTKTLVIFNVLYVCKILQLERYQEVERSMTIPYYTEETLRELEMF